MVAGGKINLKKGATKVLATVLSALSVAGGIGANAMQTPVEKPQKPAEEPHIRFLKRSGRLMGGLINLNNLKGDVLKNFKNQTHDEKYWNEDITNNLKGYNLPDNYQSSAEFAKNIEDIFGDNIILDRVISKEFIYFLKICCNFKDEKEKEELKYNWVVPKDFLDSLFENGKLNITRKKLLKVIILLIINRQKSDYSKKENKMHFNLNSLYYPLILEGNMGVALYGNIIRTIKDVFRIIDLGVEKCNELYAFLPKYFAINTLIKDKISSLNLTCITSENFLKENKSLFENWLNTTSFEEYEDYSKKILDMIYSYYKQIKSVEAQK